MGLDMYLKKHVFIGADFSHRNVKGEINLTYGKYDTPININFDNVSYIVESVGYWRKANQIHNWIVNRLNNGDDDCREYYFHYDSRKELYDICKQVIEDHSKSEELLPTLSGFFFGGNEYDDGYFQDLEDTVKILEPTLNDKINDYYYCASW